MGEKQVEIVKMVRKLCNVVDEGVVMSCDEEDEASGSKEFCCLKSFFGECKC